MKKILSITIALCLVFTSVLPVYAEAWTSAEAQQVTNDVYTLKLDLATIEALILTVLNPDSQYNQTIKEGSLQMMAINLAEIRNMLETWLIPRNITSSTGYLGLWDYVWYIANEVGTLWGGWDGYFSHLVTLPSINTNLDDLEKALTNYYRDNNSTINVATRKLFTHSDLVNSAITYPIRELSNSPRFSYTENRYSWLNGTPLGNIALILDKLNNNYVIGSQMNYDAWYEDADTSTVLGIWDSQGNTLTQEAWSPESGLNGLYKYLAYTQRDVARLTYVLASDEEIETREKARATQTAVMDDFVDPDGAGAASVDDFGSISDASSGVQSNFNTGVSAGGVWNVFERNYEWFSQETADNLAYQPNRSNIRLKASESEYDTPYLDSYYEELHDIVGF